MFTYWEERSIKFQSSKWETIKNYIEGKGPKPKETQRQQTFLKLVNKMCNKTVYFWKYVEECVTGHISCRGMCHWSHFF